MAPERLGLPGGSVFSYLAADAAAVEIIVYAINMAQAVTLYKLKNKQEPYSIRQMSDNE